MGIEAESITQAVHKLRTLPEGKEMLKYFKCKYAVFCSLDYFSLIIDQLSEHLANFSASSTILHLKNTLNLFHLVQANIKCMLAIKI